MGKDSIVHEGKIYHYEHRLAKDGEICLATLRPKEYCNGLYRYSKKDPGDGMAFVVVETEPIEAQGDEPMENYGHGTSGFFMQSQIGYDG